MSVEIGHIFNFGLPSKIQVTLCIMKVLDKLHQAKKPKRPETMRVGNVVKQNL